MEWASQEMGVANLANLHVGEKTSMNMGVAKPPLYTCSGRQGAPSLTILVGSKSVAADQVSVQHHPSFL